MRKSGNNEVIMEGFKKCGGKLEQKVVEDKTVFVCDKCGRVESDNPYKGICEVSVCAVCGKRLSSCTCPKKD